ncbi:sterol desaturase family protein [Aestuariivirga sp. YIM B02566]|uniref:sterol desaturase family protein n=1 Tax=Taklimakanibacter albus TaxID=2800327 RepID=UPI001FEFA42C|nr:sterol desaturase family protein [Aestuariivirga sp. YIM B02566]
MHEGKKIFRPAWKIDLFYAVCSALFTKLGLALVIIGTIYLASLLVPSSLSAAVAGLPLWVQVVVAIILSDLGFYAVHRLFHKIPWLWKFHAIHHSIETLDWLAGHRVHPVDQILTKGASLVPVFALGFSDSAIVIYSMIYVWQSLLLHSNVSVNLGPLRYVLALPQFHHWHHADHPEAHDKNFAGQLAFLDFIFGTHHLPGRTLPERYGTSTPVPSDYTGQLLFPFKTDQSEQPITESLGHADVGPIVGDLDRMTVR